MSDGSIRIDTRLDTSNVKEGVRSIQSQVSTLAAELRKSGLSQSEAMKKAWDEIERNTKNSTEVMKKDFREMAADFSNKTKDISDSLKSIGGSITAIGSKLSVGLTDPIVSMGKNILKVGMDFEASLSGIKAVTGATAEEMELLKAKAIEAGEDTSFSAIEASNAIEELAKAGLTTAQILDGGLDGALRLAAAGEIALAEAAAIAATALNAFEDDALSVTDAADVLAGAANASATDVGELKYALSQVGVVASSAGLSFKETNTALAVFAQNTLKGSDAGTSFKTMLMRLMPVTDDQIAAFEELGLMTDEGTSKFYNLDGSLRSMEEIFGLLNNAVGESIDYQERAALQAMFGTDAMRAATIAIEKGAVGYNAMNDAMSKFTSAEVAAERLNNLKARVGELDSKFDSLKLKLFETQDGALSGIVTKVTELVSWLLKLDDSTLQTIIIFAGMAAAIGPVLVVVGQLTVAFGEIMGVMSSVSAAIVGMGTGATGLSAVFTALTGPIGIIIAILAVLAVSFVYLYTTNKEFQTSILEVWENIKKSVSSAIESLISIFDGFIKHLSDTGALEGIQKALLGTWEAIQLGLKVIWMGIITVVEAVFGGIADFLTENSKEITAMLTEAWDIIWSILEPIWNKINEVFMQVFGDIKAFIEKWGPALREIFANTFQIIFETGKKIFDDFKAFWDTWGGTIVTLFKGVLDQIKNAFDLVWGQIKNLIELFMNTIQNVIKLVLAIMKGDWEGAWKALENIVAGVVKYIGSTLDNLKKFFVDSFNTIKSTLGSINLMELGKNIIQGLINGIMGKAKEVQSAISGIANGITGTVKNVLGIRSPSKAMFEIGVNVDEGLIEGVDSMKGQVSKTFADLTESMLSDSSANATNETKAVSKDMTEGSYPLVKNISVSSLSNLARMMESAVSATTSSLSAGFSSTVNNASSVTNNNDRGLTFIMNYSGNMSRSEAYDVGRVSADQLSRELRSKGISAVGG